MDVRPGILVISCHDLGRWLGCYGVASVYSPHLDRLAGDGVLLRNAFCTAPQCSPSRASLFTGRYPHSNGVLGLTHGDFGWDLHPEERHIAQLLREAGYDCVLVGLHHESREAARCGLEQIIPQSSGRVTTEAALARLAEYAAGEQPFFMHVGYHEPHRVAGAAELDYMGFIDDYITPSDELGITIPSYLIDESSARRELAELQGAVRYLDAAVGALLAGIDALGLAEGTLLLFTTDHGVALPRAKCSLYDPGLEITLILRWQTGGWAGGRALDTLVSNLDVVPTLLETLDLPLPDDLHGHSLRPLLDGGTQGSRDAIHAELTYHDYYDPRRCIRTERHKLIVNFSEAPAFMDPSQSWRPRTRTVVPPDPATAFHPLIELYDLIDDPHEWHNLADAPEHAPLRDMLLAQLRDWMTATDDPLLHGAVTAPMHRRALAALGQPLPQRSSGQ
jgi:arylsulfatase A-like enzyme